MAAAMSSWRRLRVDRPEGVCDAHVPSSLSLATLLVGGRGTCAIHVRITLMSGPILPHPRPPLVSPLPDALLQSGRIEHHGFEAALAGRPTRRHVRYSRTLVPFACPTSLRRRRDMRETWWKTSEVTPATASRRRLRVDRPEGVCDANVPSSLSLAPLRGGVGTCMRLAGRLAK